MTTYAESHAKAYAKLAPPIGVAAAFTRTVPGTYDAATDTALPETQTVVAVHAIAKRSDPSRLAALDLLQNKSLTLLCAPSVHTLRALTPEFVLPLDRIDWNGVTLTVRDVGPMVALDGYVVTSEVLVTA